MKNTVLLLSLFSSILSLAQPTPFVKYLGDRGTIDVPRDFTTTLNGEYQLHASGNYDLLDHYDQVTYTLDAATGELDSTLFSEIRNQEIFSAEEDGNGGAIVTLLATSPNAVQSDLVIRHLSSNNEVIAEFTAGSPHDVIPIETAISEDLNHYTAYNQELSPYTTRYRTKLLKIRNAQSIAYDIDLELSIGFVYDLIPLPDGEVVVLSVTRNELGMNVMQVTRLTTDGQITWRSSLTDYSLLLEGLLHNGELLIVAPINQQLIVLDLASGEISNTYTMTDTQSLSFSTDFFIQEDRFWLIGLNSLIEMRLDLSQDLFYAEATYPIDANSLLRARHRSGAIEILNQRGHLQRVDINTGTTTTVHQFQFPTANYSINEHYTRAYYDESTNNFVVSTDNNRNGSNAYRLGSDGSTLSFTSIPVEAEQQVIQHFTVPLPTGRTGLTYLPINSNPGQEQIDFQLFDENGNLIREEILLPPADQTVDLSRPHYLPEGQILLGAYVFDFELFTDRIIIYYIDPNGLLATESFFISDWPGDFYRLFPLQSEALGLISFTRNPDNYSLYLNRLNYSGDFQREYELTFDGEDIRAFANSPITWVASDHDSERSIVGINLQVGADDPIYYITVLNEDGSVHTRFSPTTTLLSASITYTSEGLIKLIGCSINPDRTSPNDLYRLHYETYDIDGNLLEEVSHSIPYLYAISEINSISDSGFLLMTGEAIRDFDSDGLLIIFDPQGQITSTFHTPSTWAKVNVSPNPSEGQLHVDLSNDFTGDLLIHLFNTNGQEIRQWHDVKNTEKWQWNTSLAELPAGTYWVQVKSEAGQVTRLWQKM